MTIQERLCFMLDKIDALEDLTFEQERSLDIYDSAVKEGDLMPLAMVDNMVHERIQAFIKDQALKNPEEVEALLNERVNEVIAAKNKEIEALKKRKYLQSNSCVIPKT